MSDPIERGRGVPSTKIDYSPRRNPSVNVSHYVLALVIEIESQALGGFVHLGWVTESDPCAIRVATCVERDRCGSL